MGDCISPLFVALVTISLWSVNTQRAILAIKLSSCSLASLHRGPADTSEELWATEVKHEKQSDVQFYTEVCFS